MNKEIKFRLWDGKKFSYTKFPKTILNEDESLEPYIPFWLDKYPNDYRNFTLQQFTGFKDKNNKDIYEGDIVKSDLEHITCLLERNESIKKYTNAEIRMLSTAFKVCQKNIGATYMNDFITCDCCPCGLEIIGNIFENPELK